MFIWPDSYNGIVLVPVFLFLPLGLMIGLYAALFQIGLLIIALAWFVRRGRKKGVWDIIDTIFCLGIYVGVISITNLLFFLFRYLGTV